MARQRNNPPPVLGKAIRSLRGQKGLTLEDLAKRSGISMPWLSKIENGHINPRYASVGQIARGLGVTLAQLGTEEARIEGREGLPPRLGEADSIDVAICFGRNVRRLREESGWSQEQLATCCALPRQTIEEIEGGRSLPVLDTLVKLIGSLEKTVEELFTALPAWLPDEGGAGQFAMAELREAE